MARIRNISKPPQVLVFAFTAEECESIGIQCETQEIMLAVTDKDGNRLGRLVNQTLPPALRLMPGQVAEVAEGLLEIPKVKRAIRGRKLRLESAVEVELRPVLDESQIETDQGDETND